MRWIGTLLLASLAALAIAQAPFTIVRPVEGSKVREQVKVLVPKNSIPPGGYVGIYLNGQFSEAMVPSVSGKFYEYVLDTKSLNIADGALKIELVLYEDFNDEPRIVDRSSVNVVVANKANIPIPDSGLKLRYKFILNTETVYNVSHRVALSTISVAESQKGGRAAQLPLESEAMQMIYAVDNTYANGDALLRLQPAVPKGQKAIFLQLENSPNGAIVTDANFTTVYMRVTNTGNEVFGSMPVTFPVDGINPRVPGIGVVDIKPLPTLPARTVKPGQIWQTRFQIGLGVPNPDAKSVVNVAPGRSEFEGVEWEMGHPCAKIHQSIVAGGTVLNGIHISVDETFWFALDKGVIVKMIREEAIDGIRAVEMNPAVPAGGGPPIQPAPRGIVPTGSSLIRSEKLAQGPPPGSVPPEVLARIQAAMGGRGGAPGGAPGAVVAPTPQEQRLVRMSVEEIYVLEG